MEIDALERSHSQVSRKLTAGLFAVGILLFVVTRLFRLDDFPIFFFCDEAYIGVEAGKLLADGFRSSDGIWFPMFWEKASQRWVPQISIYLSLIPAWLFPHSITALRLVTVVLALVGSIAACYACREVFRLQYSWWTPVFIMAVMPVYFIHSRLAFETANVISLYLVFIGSYCAYRNGNDRAVWIALAAVFLMFYSHMSGMIVIAFTVAGLALIHLPWHVRRWRTLLPAAGACIVLLIPFLVWRLHQPDAISQQLSTLGSSWAAPDGIFRGVAEGMDRYLAVFSLDYWFFPQDIPDEMRHLWKGRGFMSGWMILPFLIGALAVVSTLLRPLHQVLLVAFFAGAAPVIFVESHIQRVFYIVAPCCYIIAIGIDLAVKWMSRIVPYSILLAAFALGLTSQGVLMLREAVNDASVWYPVYGLGGMQWGARQLFADAIPRFLREHPGVTLVPSGNWANGADIFPEFFLSTEQRSRLTPPPFELLHPEPEDRIPNSYVFILSRDDQKTLRESGMFMPFKPLLTVNDPDGRPGFIFTELKYVSNIDEILAPERELRRSPVTERAEIWGSAASVTFSKQDMGQIQDILDGDRTTLLRGMSANPFILDMKFETPVKGRRIQGVFFPMRFLCVAEIWTPSSKTPVRVEVRQDESDPRRDSEAVLVLSDSPLEISRIRLEIHELSLPPDRAHVHIRELNLEK